MPGATYFKLESTGALIVSAAVQLAVVQPALTWSLEITSVNSLLSALSLTQNSPRASRQFFVSQSGGNDANDGLTTGTPWKTLGKLNLQVFFPGDQIWLKQGDTWTGETLSMGGYGTYDVATYASTYNSTYSTNLAAYLAGTKYSDFHTLLTNAGYTDPVASNAANYYCTRHAIADAVAAGQAAAVSSSTWVTVAGYGGGANPMIAPGGTILACVQAPNGTRGGFRFVNIDLSNAQAAGFDFAASNATTAKAFRVEGGNITNITGMHVPQNSGEGDYAAAGLNVFCGTAINVWRADYTSVVGTTISLCDMGIYFQGSSDTLALNVVADHLYCEGHWCSLITSHLYPVGPQNTIVIQSRNIYQGGSVSYVGFQRGIWWGTAGVQFNGGIDCGSRAHTVDHQTGIAGVTPDQVSYDQEGYGASGTFFLDCIATNGGGAFLLIDGQAAGSTGTIVAGCTSTSNGGLFSGVTYPTFMRIFHPATLGDNVIVVGNTITRFVGTQKLNDIEDTGTDPQGKQDAFPARFIVAGNTVTN